MWHMIGCTRTRIRLRSVEPRTRLCGFVGHADSYRMSRMRGSFTQSWPCIPTCAFKGDARGEVHSVPTLLANEDLTAPVRDTLVEENELPSARSSRSVQQRRRAGGVPKMRGPHIWGAHDIRSGRDAGASDRRRAALVMGGHGTLFPAQTWALATSTPP